MSLELIMIALAVIFGVAYFSVRNSRKQKERASKRKKP
jgi:hypothetical protein